MVESDRFIIKEGPDGRKELHPDPLGEINLRRVDGLRIEEGNLVLSMGGQTVLLKLDPRSAYIKRICIDEIPWQSTNSQNSAGMDKQKSHRWIQFMFSPWNKPK